MTLDERKSKFFKEAIGDRTRDQLAEELWGIYLVCRSECPHISEDSPDDTWEMDLHLADVVEKYVIRPIREEGENR